MQTATQFITYHQQQAICMLHVVHYLWREERKVFWLGSGVISCHKKF
jgi:hypothetical protein